MNFSWLTPRSRPIVVAHRGSAGRAPENTLAAFRLAHENGADAIELDVHLSKDGQVVVIHDRNLDRTTDGSGPIRNYTLRQLKKCNAGYRWQREFRHERIPTLEEVFAEFGSAIGINVEIKGVRTATVRQELMKKCIALIQKYKLYGTVLISSFSSKTVKEVGALDSRIVRGLLYDPLYHPLHSPAAYAESQGIQYLIISRTKLHKKIVNGAHAGNLMVGEFGVNTDLQTKRSLRYGIDAIYTDYPSEVLTYLHRPK
jgi:glycerophosphoryl diester phosphodiesterase